MTKLKGWQTMIWFAIAVMSILLLVKRKRKMNKIDRIEIIDETGRVYVRRLSENEWLEYSLQDDSRTLKMFIDNGEADKK
jgi:hypothetical protein